MQIDALLTDDAILEEVGRRLTQRRIDLQFSQAELSNLAGVAKRTVERMEAGAPSQLPSLIKVLRVLDLLGELNLLVPDDAVRPMDLLQLQGKARQRVARNRHLYVAEGKPQWKWGDEA